MLELSGTGDDGTTGLLGGGRSPKDDPRIEAFGTVDILYLIIEARHRQGIHQHLKNCVI